MRIFIVLALAFMAMGAHPMLENHLKALIQTGYAVDTVVQLLIAMDRVTADHLDTLISNWADVSANFEARIAGLQEVDALQHEHCNLIDGTISEIEHEIERYGAYIGEAESHIETNIATLSDRLAKRCVSNLIFVEKLKSNQDAQRLLTFLRTKVADPGFAAYLEGSNAALVELRHAVKTSPRSALSLIAKHHMLAFIQQAYSGEDNLHYDTQARSDEEIGSGHVDNDKGAIGLGGFTIDARNLDDFIAELLLTIDSLLQQLHDENSQLQANEFNAVENLIEYQDQVENENAVLGVYIGQWSQHVTDLQATLEQDQEASQECHDRADELDAAVAGAQDEYADASAQFDERRSSLSATLHALEEIIDVYVDKVLGASEVYKQRIDEQLRRTSRPADQSEETSWGGAANVSVGGGRVSGPSYSEEEVNANAEGDYRNDSDEYTVSSFSDNVSANRNQAYNDKEANDQYVGEYVSQLTSEIGSQW